MDRRLSWSSWLTHGEHFAHSSGKSQLAEKKENRTKQAHDAEYQTYVWWSKKLPTSNLSIIRKAQP